MTSSGTKDVSFVVTSLFMKCVGIWVARNNVEKLCRNIVLVYSIFMNAFGIYLEMINFYHSRNIISDYLYNLANILTVVLCLTKLFVIFIYKNEFLSLIFYMKRKFWHTDYDHYEMALLTKCRRTCTYFICLFSFLAQTTVANYVLRPVIENIGKNESDRILPLKMDLKLSMSPYFEIMYLIQSLSINQIGLSYFSFDNFLCIMSQHVACQFRILQHKLANINVEKNEEDRLSNKFSASSSKNYYATFRRCIKQHQMLIAYCDKLEHVYSIIILVQVLVFSALICLDGYQILIVSILRLERMASASASRRSIFVFHVAAVMCQLLMFTYSCDCLIQESTKLAIAVYNGPWENLPMNDYGKMLRKELIFVIARSRVPCCLTACKFSAISLETYTKVLSTAMSYFTLLRQRTTYVKDT